MDLYLAGNFVIMGNKEREKELQEKLGTDCCRLGSFFYRKEIEIVTELKGEELYGTQDKEKIDQEKSPIPRIKKCPAKKRIGIVRKKGITRNNPTRKARLSKQNTG